jgi:SAM-dependent methyltransferase
MSVWYRRFFDRDYVHLLRNQMDARRTRAEADLIVMSVGLRRGDRVLDVACGFGRHAAELARRGFDVTGVDLSAAMLAEGRRLHPRVKFLKMDMRRLPFVAEFDAVINMFTSFGYFTPRENLATLRRMARALRPGGRLLIDHRDWGWMVKHASPNRWSKVGPTYVLETNEIDRGRVRSEWLLLTPGKRRVARQRHEIRMWTRAGWRALLRSAGLTPVRIDKRGRGRLLIVGRA